MKKFKIAYGLKDFFGGAGWDNESYEFIDEDSAMEYAYDRACNMYDNNSGLYGLRAIGDIMDEDNVNESKAWETYRKERESWIEYGVEEIKVKMKKFTIEYTDTTYYQTEVEAETEEEARKMFEDGDYSDGWDINSEIEIQCVEEVED